jgi:hypothetical protein
MNPSEISAIRRRLRAVNIEYSALLRNKPGEGRFVRMGELRNERRALVALIAGRRRSRVGEEAAVSQRTEDALVQTA